MLYVRIARENLVFKPGCYFDGNRYIQHNPAIANGLDGLGAALKWMAENNIFRLENGKIVEHWDNIQTIPTDGQWANPNGKFGF